MWLKFLTTKSNLENAEFISIIISLLASFADHLYFASSDFFLIFCTISCHFHFASPAAIFHFSPSLLPFFILHHISISCMYMIKFIATVSVAIIQIITHTIVIIFSWFFFFITHDEFSNLLLLLFTPLNKGAPEFKQR